MAFDYRVGDVVRVVDAGESTLIPGALMLVTGTDRNTAGNISHLQVRGPGSSPFLFFLAVRFEFVRRSSAVVRSRRRRIITIRTKD